MVIGVLMMGIVFVLIVGCGEPPPTDPSVTTIRRASPPIPAPAPTSVPGEEDTEPPKIRESPGAGQREVIPRILSRYVGDLPARDSAAALNLLRLRCGTMASIRREAAARRKLAAGGTRVDRWHHSWHLDERLPFFFFQ